MQCHLKLIHNWRRHLLFQSEFLGAPSVFVCKKCWFHQNPSGIPADVIEITISIEKTIFGKRQTILRTIYVKFRFSEKDTKNWKTNSHLLWRLPVKSQKKWEIFFQILWSSHNVLRIFIWKKAESKEVKFRCGETILSK